MNNQRPQYAVRTQPLIINSNSTGGGPSITSEYAINIYNSLLISTKTPNTMIMLENVKNMQNKEEKELVANTSVCGIPILNGLRDHISGLKSDILKEYVTTQLQNPDAMKATMCTVDSVFYSSAFDVGSLNLNNRIRQYFHNLRQIGEDSIEGYALSGDFENATDFFILKVSRSPTDDTLLHELVIGLYGTNELRKYIPNFAYIYGGFKCSPPLIDPDTKKVVTWCLHQENAVNYVIYENIVPSISLDEYVATCTGAQFVNVYMQLLYSLRIALKMIDFTHYDLHYKNVLVRSVPQYSGIFQIAYETEIGLEYISTNVIATIIDYGYAHIKTGDFIDVRGKVIKPGQHYGRSGVIPYSVYPYRSWIMHDMYKILMFSMEAAYKANNQNVLIEIEKIFKFFNKTENPVNAMNAQKIILYSFPLTSDTNKLSINCLATHIKRVCNTNFLSPTRNTAPMLDCEKICLTEGAIYTGIGMNPQNPIGTPDNIIEYFDILTRLHNEGRDAEKDRLELAFPYRKAMLEHLNKLRQLINDLIMLRAKVKLFDIGDLSIDQVLTYNTMMLMRSTYISIASIIDKSVDLRFYYDIGVVVAKSHQDTASLVEMNKIAEEFNKDIRPTLEDAKRIIGNNDIYLNRIKVGTVTEAANKCDPRLSWYWEGRTLFDIAFGRIDVTLQ